MGKSTRDKWRQEWCDRHDLDSNSAKSWQLSYSAWRYRSPEPGDGGQTQVEDMEWGQ